MVVSHRGNMFLFQFYDFPFSPSLSCLNLTWAWPSSIPTRQLVHLCTRFSYYLTLPNDALPGASKLHSTACMRFPCLRFV